MRIENILALTQAKLLNSPIVSDFGNITYELKKLKRGDLFLAFEQEDISQAVALGAYGVLFEGMCEVVDSEIAWMQVESLDLALLKIIRFTLINKSLEVYECSDVLIGLANSFLYEAAFVVLSGESKQIYKRLLEIDNGTTLLFCAQDLSRDLFTNIEVFNEDAQYPIRMVEQTLFESSFVAGEHFYERQLLCPLFIGKLASLLAFLEQKKISFSSKKILLKEHFEPVFVSNTLEPREFGSTQKVLIFEKNVHYIVAEMLFLREQAPWAKSIFVLPRTLYEQFKTQEDALLVYDEGEEIIELLEKRDFHFALIFGVTKSILKVQKSRQLTLEF